MGSRSDPSQSKKINKSLTEANLRGISRGRFSAVDLMQPTPMNRTLLEGALSVAENATCATLFSGPGVQVET